MADFQAAIGNITITPTSISVEDLSNYTASLEDGHQEVNFSDYRKIIMNTPKRTFSYSTEGDGDVITGAGDTVSNVRNFPLNNEDIDGVYDFIVYTVPTWNSFSTYNRFDTVYLSGKLYRSKDNGLLSVNPTTSTDWEEIDETLLGSKYSAVDSAVITDRNLLACYEKMVFDSVCELEADLCADICESKDFQDAMKMRLLIDAICVAAANNDFPLARQKFNLANKLCNIS